MNAGVTEAPVLLDRAAIERLLARIELVPLMERAFVAEAQGRAQLAAVGELLFSDPPGEVHVKTGHIAGDGAFVVKVASGFYANPARGLPSSSGLMLLFDAGTGRPRAILLDEGILTDARTAAAGAVAAKHMAPSDPGEIAILGAGIQAGLQLAQLPRVTACRRVAIWARRQEAAERLAVQATELGFIARAASTPASAARDAGLVVTCTPAEAPLLSAGDVRGDAHITAVGADGPHKSELGADLIARATFLAADSVKQARERGEFRRAPADAPIRALGALIEQPAPRRAGISVADLTGLAVQDLVIAQAILAAHEQERPAP